MHTSPQKKQQQKRKMGEQALSLCSRKMLKTMGTYTVKAQQNYKYRIDVIKHEQSKFMKIMYENPQCIFTTYEIKQAQTTQWFYAITKYQVSLRRLFNVMEFNPKQSLHIFAAMVQQVQKIHEKNLFHRVIEPRNTLIVKNAKIRFSKYHESIYKTQFTKEKLYHTSQNQIERNPYIHPILKGNRFYLYNPAHCDVFSIVICFLDFFFKRKIMPNFRETNTRTYFYDNSKCETDAHQRLKKNKIQAEWNKLAQKDIDKYYLTCGGLKKMFMELFVSDKPYSLKDLQNNSFYQNHIKLMNQVDFFQQLIQNPKKDDQNSDQETDDPIVKTKQYVNLKKTNSQNRQKQLKSKLIQSQNQFFRLDKKINLNDIFIKEELFGKVIQLTTAAIQKIKHHFQQTKIKIPFLQQFEKIELKLKENKLIFNLTTRGLSLQNFQQKSFLYSQQIDKKLLFKSSKSGYHLSWGKHEGDSRVIEKMGVFIQSLIYQQNRELQLKTQKFF